MRNIIYLILLLNTAVLFGQEELKARLIYEVSLKKHDKNVNLKPNQKKYNTLADKSGTKLFFLDIKNHESIFYKEPKMNSDGDKKVDMLSIIIDNDKFYFHAIDSTILKEKSFLGEDFLVIKTQDIDWNLTQEESKCGIYTCYKATANKIITNRLGRKINKNILAWYTLDIPIKAGIKDYQGLPGTIVSLEGEGLVYKLLEIKLNPVELLEVTKPSKGKILTENEYNKILLGNYRSRF